jgi:asparagine synthase (glutamine-hydrolysing)
MCGIVSLYSHRPDAPPVDPEELDRIMLRLVPRGPDDGGTWTSPDARVALGSRRLAIIDLRHEAAQPMAHPDGSCIIVFNGEIYNYRELRAGLERGGAQFRTLSDTEVLLYLYAAKGAAMVEDLRGMFAFALWDLRERKMLLARDPYGIKPLYYADDGRTLRVASTVKALLAGGRVSRTPDPAGAAGFFLMGSVPEPFTLYEQIRSLPAGSYLFVDQRGVGEIQRYYTIAGQFREGFDRSAPLTAGGARERIRESVADSLRAHFVADVPVGAFLSSGIDSAALVALSSPLHHQPLQTITLAFDEYRGREADEAPLAESIARHFGTRHTTRVLTRSEFLADVPKILDAMDQPTIDGMNTWFVSKAAREQGLKVAISGLGGDELFGSYPSFRQIPKLVKAFRWPSQIPGAGALFRMATRPLAGGNNAKFPGLLQYGGTYGGAYFLRRGLHMPWELPKLMGREAAEEGLRRLRLIEQFEEALLPDPGGDFGRVATLEATFYMRNQLLRDTDWSSMAHSLEVRVPLVDAWLLRELAPVLVASAGRNQKVMFGESPAEPLPREVLEREKTGFTIPMREWLGQELGESKQVMRAWARALYDREFARATSPLPGAAPRDLRVLHLTTDAFGGHGGIALYNRDFLQALASHERVAQVVVLPRHVVNPLEAMPPRVDFRLDSVGGKFRWARALASLLVRRRDFDLVVCGHINLLFAAHLAAKLCRTRPLLLTYGIDVWKRPRGTPGRFVNDIAGYVAISDVTRRKFLAWSRTVAPGWLLPNAIHLDRYDLRPKDAHLASRYGLDGKRVLMTFGRMVSSERYKGFDEVLDVLPSIVEEVPDVVYLLAGEGQDRCRLERKAAELGLDGHVVFTGLVKEEEKAALYSLADVYVMPSRGEGFGFVFLEAMAAGIPVIGSRVDGGREALRDGALGALVDPDDRTELRRSIMTALASGTRTVPPGLEYFAYPEFERRAHEIVDQVMGK